MLSKFILWPEKHPRFCRAFQTLLLLVYATFALRDAWVHSLKDIVLDCVFLAINTWLLHQVRSYQSNDGGQDDGDDNDPGPDSPTGDRVERWLKSQCLTTAK